MKINKIMSFGQNKYSPIKFRTESNNKNKFALILLSEFEIRPEIIYLKYIFNWSFKTLCDII